MRKQVQATKQRGSKLNELNFANVLKRERKNGNTIEILECTSALR